MIWAVAAEAAAICVLTLLVLALAHAYAGLAAAVRTRGGDGGPAVDVPPRAVASTGRSDGSPAALEGATPDGEHVVIPLVGATRHTLLAFFSSTCATCRGLLDDLGDVPSEVLAPDVRVVVVAKGPERESPAELARLTGDAGLDVVLSSSAWTAWAVPGSPYFVLVDRASGGVLGEGTAGSWAQVASLLALSQRDRGSALGGGARRHESEVDHALREAGILPGDASLYPPSARALAS